ncbi:uncharacterized protein F58A4.6-like [Rhagoletis pomonella]|uniref:uncharacterized protein F58A4.6-like n=1 Tax=Rhagoletis pomonella TaxID=28610 RepID=UPI00177CC212|nr:uncharacterized protein F58A4.6-like [Rhagoletis pomonella]
MTILICISDFAKHQEFLEIDNNNNIITVPRKSLWRRVKSLRASNQSHGGDYAQIDNSARTLRRLSIEIDGINAFYLVRELHLFTQFRMQLSTNPALRDADILWLQLRPPKKEVIDYKWNRILSHTLWERIEVEYLMSWLSTLGGGYSALGEQFTRCAEVAGKISLRQLHIGLRVGDPFLQARCKLYYSISLIQTGRLRQAKYIIREQYKFAKKQKEVDGRLVKMCQGIWLRLQYEYGMRLKSIKHSPVSYISSGDK